MTYNYKAVLDPLLEKTEEEIMTYVEGVLANPDSVKLRKVKELSNMLRKHQKSVIAAKVGKKLYEADQTPNKPDSLNMYLIAVVDSGDTEKIRVLEKKAADELKTLQPDAEQQLHLYATRLAGANRIQDNEMFENIYKDVPDGYKTGNDYIVHQYYTYLWRNGRYQEIVNHYNSLDSVMQGYERLKSRYNDAVSKIGTNKPKPSVFLIGADSLSLDFQLTKIVLDDLVQVIAITGDTTSEIVQEMDKNTLGNSFAVVLGKDFDEFAWGYFFGKVGASNLIILMNEELIKGDEAKKKAADSVTSHGLTGFSLFPLPDMKDLTKWKNELLECMKLSGLKIS